jgi:hypothetical protein
LWLIVHDSKIIGKECVAELVKLIGQTKLQLVMLLEVGFF